MKQDNYPLHAVTANTTLFGYENSNPKITRNYQAFGLSSPENISNGDLIFDGEHSVDFDGYRWTWIHGKELLADFSTNPPSTGLASVNIGGYGDAVENVLWRLSNGNGITSYEAYGDRSHLFTGAVKIEGRLTLTGLPTSAAGLPTGGIWNDSGTLKIV